MPGTMNQHYPNSSTSRSRSGRGSNRRRMLLLFITASIINVLQLPLLSLALTTTSAFITSSSIMHQHCHHHHPHPIVLLSQRSTSSSSSPPSMKCFNHHVDDDGINVEAHNVDNINRRKFLKEKPALIVSSVIAATVTTTTAAAPAFAAASTKSRTDGYKVQHSDREWSYILSGQQYNVLRQGGTERQKSSILNTFTSKDHVGTYVCAGCNTPLFASESKFSSGTGWPSFAYSSTDSISNTKSDGGSGGGGNEIGGVEIEQLDPIRSALNGREVRCNTCGGHLGDLFNDGYMYIGTSAFDSGQRYCIDGSALIFKPTSTTDGLVVTEGEDTRIFGDMPPPNKTIRYEQSMYRN